MKKSFLVDRLVLIGQVFDFAIKHGIPHGGWIPKGRKTEEGPLSLKYHLRELNTASYSKRTLQNILDSDGTLIISNGRLSGGSALTREFAKKHNHSWIHLNMKILSLHEAGERLRKWVIMNNIKVLNVAGPRASKDFSIYQVSMNLLEESFYNST